MEITPQLLDGLTKTAEQAAKSAGKYALEHISQAQSRIKNGVEMVTDIDSRCQDMIIETIQRKWDGHGFIAEEGREDRVLIEKPKQGQKLWWVIDPIDGTNNYAHGLRHFSVSIGVCMDGVPIAGAIYEPASDMMYSAAADRPAVMNKKPINTGEEQFGELTGIGIDSPFEEGLPGWVEYILRNSKFRNFGSTALHMAYVANGGLGAAVIKGGAKLWDIAAGGIITERAGALVTDFEGQSVFPMNFETYTGGKFQLIVANPTIHPQILNLIKEVK